MQISQFCLKDCTVSINQVSSVDKISLEKKLTK